MKTVALALAAVCAATGLALIWIARLSAIRWLYVSELGAEGESTAALFRVALTFVAVAALLAAVGVGSDALTPRARVFRLAPPSLMLLVTAGSFAVSSQVTCTRLCPLPFGATFTWQDFVHTLFATLGFGSAAWVMLQVASDSRRRRLARVSLACAVAVALFSGAGGILSLLRFARDSGSALEFAATTVALAWLSGTALYLAVRGSPPRPVTEHDETVESGVEALLG